MSNKLRITLGVFLLVAVFLVVRIFMFIGSHLITDKHATIVRSQGTAMIGQSQGFPKVYEDADRDGLSDIQETRYGTDIHKADTDGDGFVDGEEVISGYDPMKKGGDEKMVPNNVTESFTNKLIGGVYAGDLDPKKTDKDTIQKNLSMVALATLTEAGKRLSPDTVPQWNIVKVSNSPAAQEEYLRRVASVFDDIFANYYTTYPKLMTEGVFALKQNDSVKATAAFHQLAMISTEKYEAVVQLPVPEKFYAFHQKMLSIFSFFAKNFEALEHYEDDPVVGYMALTRVNGAGSLLPAIVQDARELVKDQSLNLPQSPLFETFSLINQNL